MQNYSPARKDSLPVKTVSVRIPTEQAGRIQELLGVIPGGSLNAVVQDAVSLWLDIEGPVLEAKRRRWAKMKRQDVPPND